VITLQIESEGEQLVARTFMRFADDVETPRTALEEVADELRRITRQQFESEGGHGSGGWKPLTEARRIFKQRHNLDPHILRATNVLMRSLTEKFAAGAIERLSGDSLIYGSAVPYGIFHQSSQPRSKMPFRPPVALTTADKRRIVKLVQAQLISGQRRAHAPLWGA
jgi:phage gpG-like protein